MRRALAILCVAGCGRFGTDAGPTMMESGAEDAGAKDASSTVSADGSTGDAQVDGSGSGSGSPCAAIPVLAFNVAGGVVRNVGSAGSNATGKVLVHEDFPVLVDTGPIGPHAPSQTGSLDFGDTPPGSTGVRSVDFTDPSLGQAITGSLLTITGWVQLADQSFGAGGNRLISSLDNSKGEGIELVQSGRGLRLGINGYADQTAAPQSGDHLAFRSDGPPTASDWTFSRSPTTARARGTTSLSSSVTGTRSRRRIRALRTRTVRSIRATCCLSAISPPEVRARIPTRARAFLAGGSTASASFEACSRSMKFAASKRTRADDPSEAPGLRSKTIRPQWSSMRGPRVIEY